MNEVAKRTGTAMSVEDARKQLQGYRNTAPRGTGGADLLRLLKTGEWVFGQNNDEPDPKSVWAVNSLSFQQGFCCWDRDEKNTELLGEIMVPFNQPRPEVASLTAYESNPWAEQIAFDLKCIKGPDKGVQVMYKASSKGGITAHGDLLDDILAHEGDDIHPLVLLKIDSYKHKKWGKTFTPDFEVVGWTSHDVEPVDEDPEPEPDGEPEVEENEEQEEAPPPRRRRRRS